MRRTALLSLIFMIGLVASLSVSAAPSLYLTPTPTPPVDGTEVLNNGDFETPGNSRLKAAGWSVDSKNRRSHRVCQGKWGHESRCAFRLRNGMLSQDISFDSVIPADALELSGWVKGLKLYDGARVAIAVTYTSGAQESFSYELNTGTYTYEQLQQSFDLSEPVTNIRVALINGRRGRLVVDDLSLKLVQTTDTETPPYTSPAVSISADNTTVEVGDTVTIDVALTDLGIPMYTLNLSTGARVRVNSYSQIDGEIVNDDVFEIVSATGTATGAQFVLRAVGTGNSDVSVHVSGEAFMPEPPPGAWYWTAVTSSAVTLTVE